MVDAILWSILGFWTFVWVVSIAKLLAYPSFIRSHAKIKYGIIDVLGILALVGLIVRNW